MKLYFIFSIFAALILSWFGLQEPETQRIGARKHEAQLTVIDSSLHHTKARLQELNSQTAYDAETVREVYSESCK